LDVPEIGDNVAVLLRDYVENGGGLFWFLGSGIDRDLYNRTLGGPRRLLPGVLGDPIELAPRSEEVSPDVILGRAHPLIEPLLPIGDAAFAVVGLTRSWSFTPMAADVEPSAGGDVADGDAASPVREILLRRDGRPLVTQHDVGRGRVITSLVGLDGSWTNWSGDPTFVVFLLQANAFLWSAASPPVDQSVVDGIRRSVPADTYAGDVTFLPPVDDPPRVPVQWTPRGEGPGRVLSISPMDEVISGGSDVDSLLQPGIAELVLSRVDGQTEVLPAAMVIAGGESDLARAAPEEIRRAVQPVDVRFVSAGELAEQYGGSSGSATTLVLLALLAIFLAIEQVLAYLSSYHPPASAHQNVPHLGGLATAAVMGTAGGTAVGAATRRHQR
jgi:hypothetical protein